MSTRRGAPWDPTAPAARRRRRYLWGSAVVWLPLLVLGLGLVLRDANARTGVAQYERGDVSGAARRFEDLGAFDLLERWKEPFGHGTTLYLTDDLWGAERELDRALTLVPDEHRCTVQINRSLVLEAWGDQQLVWSQQSADWADAAQRLTDAGEPYPDLSPWGSASPRQLSQEARDSAAWAARYFEDALLARQDPACDQQAPPEQEQNQQGQERLEDKLDRAEQQAQPEEHPDGEPEGATTPQEEEAERQRQLAERTAEGQARAELERQQRSGGGTGKGW